MVCRKVLLLTMVTKSSLPRSCCLVTQRSLGRSVALRAKNGFVGGYSKRGGYASVNLAIMWHFSTSKYWLVEFFNGNNKDLETIQELLLKIIPSQSRLLYPPLRSVPTACLLPTEIQVYFTCTLVLVQVYPCTSSFTATFFRASSTDVTG